MLGAIALGNGLPLGGEHLPAAAMAFAYIFIACAAAMALSLALFHRMPEKPLRGRAESGMPATAE